MTTFETIVIVLLAIIAEMMLLIFAYMCWHFRSVESWQRNHFNELRAIRVNVATTAEYTQNHIAPDVELISSDVPLIREYINNCDQLLDIMHKNVCSDVAEKMVDRAFPIKEGESLDAAFEPDYRLTKDIENKLNGFAAAVLDAECCSKEMIDLWSVRICTSAYKFIKQFKIDWHKLSKEQQDEFLKRMICPNYDSPFKPPFEPTAQDAILNKPTDNSNKSTNYNGYDPTAIVRGKED